MVSLPLYTLLVVSAALQHRERLLLRPTYIVAMLPTLSRVRQEMKLEGYAEVKGDKLNITLPLWQIITLLLAGVVVITSVVYTTRDLTAAVNRLDGSVNLLSRKLDDIDDRVDKLEAHREVEQLWRKGQ